MRREGLVVSSSSSSEEEDSESSDWSGKEEAKAKAAAEAAAEAERKYQAKIALHRARREAKKAKREKELECVLFRRRRPSRGLTRRLVPFPPLPARRYMRHVLAPRRAGAGPWPPPRAPATTEAMQVVCFEYLAEVAGGLRAASATSLAGTAGTAGGHHRRAGSATALALGELDFLLNPRTGYVKVDSTVDAFPTGGLAEWTGALRGTDEEPRRSVRRAPRTDAGTCGASC